MRNRLTMSALLAVAAVGMATPASATTTFAQFTQTLPGKRIFTYTNSTGTTKAKLGTVSGSNTVFVSDLGTLISPSIAKVSLVGTASALPTVGSNITQLFSGTMTFTLLVPQLGMSGPSTNALTVNFIDALFIASPGASAPTLQSSSSSGSVITYTSDFADLTTFTAADFALSFSGSSKVLNMAGLRLPNFQVSGTGTFAGESAVPEPASWALMLGGFGLMGAAMRSGRKAAESAAA